MSSHCLSGPSNSGLEVEASPYQHSNSGDSLSPRNTLGQQVDYNVEESERLHGRKRRRACEPCRRLKVQCHYDSSTVALCKRCIKFGRSCEVTTRRRRQTTVKTAPVSELERKIEALTASLDAIKANTSSQGTQNPLPRASDSSAQLEKNSTSLLQNPLPESSVPRNVPRDPLDIYEKVSIPREATKTPAPPSHFRQKAPPDHPAIASSKLLARPSDIFRYGKLSIEAGWAAYDHFVKFMLPNFPIINIPAAFTAVRCVREKPILFTSICNAASGLFPIETQRELNMQITRILAERILMVGEKSLELIQAVQIASIWHYPPGRFEALKYYQLIHNAAIMAIDMGLSRKCAGSKRETSIVDDTARPPSKIQSLPDPSAPECRRAWLGCYFLTSQASQNLRRENLIKWSPWLENCLQQLDNSENALPSDKILCHWVRLQHLVDDVGIHLFIEDPSACRGLDDIGIRFAIKGFDGELDRICARPLDRSETLNIGEAIVRLYTHEVALNAGSTVESDMQPPFTEEARKCLRPTQTDQLSAAHIASLSTVLTSIHHIFDLFLSIPISTLQELPTFHFVRMVYTAVVLIKMGMDSKVPNSAIGRMLSIEDFKIESYLDRLLTLLKAAAGGTRCPNAAKYGLVIGLLKSLYWNQILGKPMSGTQMFSSVQHKNSLHPAVQPSTNRPQISGDMDEGFSRTNTYQQSPLQLLSDAAAAEQQGPWMPPSLYSATDTLMSDVIDFQPMNFNLDSENFGSFFSDNFAKIFTESELNGNTFLQEDSMDGWDITG